MPTTSTNWGGVGKDWGHPARLYKKTTRKHEGYEKRELQKKKAGQGVKVVGTGQATRNTVYGEGSWKRETGP